MTLLHSKVDLMEYVYCEHCHGLFTSKASYMIHRPNSCDGSLAKSTAQLFAIDRELYAALLPLKTALLFGRDKDSLNDQVAEERSEIGLPGRKIRGIRGRGRPRGSRSARRGRGGEAGVLRGGMVVADVQEEQEIGEVKASNAVDGVGNNGVSWSIEDVKVSGGNASSRDDVGIAGDENAAVDGLMSSICAERLTPNLGCRTRSLTANIRPKLAISGSSGATGNSCGNRNAPTAKLNDGINLNASGRIDSPEGLPTPGGLYAPEGLHNGVSPCRNSTLNYDISKKRLKLDPTKQLKFDAPKPASDPSDVKKHLKASNKNAVGDGSPSPFGVFKSPPFLEVKLESDRESSSAPEERSELGGSAGKPARQKSGGRGSASWKYAGQKKTYAINNRHWAEKYRDHLVPAQDGGGEGEAGGKNVGGVGGKANDGKLEYACKQCPFRSKRIGFFARHMRVHGSEVVFTCPLCSFSGCFAYRCTSQGKLNKHTQLHTRPFMCEFCSACFAAKRDLQRHTWIHTDYLPFSCTECDYKCRYKRVLEDHQRKHSGMLLICPEAGCEFKTCYKVALDNHRVAKHELSRYECDKCDFNSHNRYKYYWHLKQHVSGALKTYTCSYCSYRAQVKHDLTRHMRKHTQEKVYYCDMCSYSSAYSQSLRLHLMQHYRFKPWRCAICSHQTFTKSRMNRHIAVVHPHSEVRPLNIGLRLGYDAKAFRRSAPTPLNLPRAPPSLSPNPPPHRQKFPPSAVENELSTEWLDPLTSELTNPEWAFVNDCAGVATCPPGIEDQRRP